MSKGLGAGVGLFRPVCPCVDSCSEVRLSGLLHRVDEGVLFGFGVFVDGSAHNGNNGQPVLVGKGLEFFVDTS